MKTKNFIRLLMVLTCLSISIYSATESIKIENDNKIYKNLPTDAILANEINNYFQENKSEFIELKDYSYQEIEVLGRRRTYLKKVLRPNSGIGQQYTIPEYLYILNHNTNEPVGIINRNKLNGFTDFKSIFLKKDQAYNIFILSISDKDTHLFQNHVDENPNTIYDDKYQHEPYKSKLVEAQGKIQSLLKNDFGSISPKTVIVLDSMTEKIKLFGLKTIASAFAIMTILSAIILFKNKNY